MSQTIDSEEKIAEIKNILIDNLEPVRIYLFGSRATGTNKEYSDFDIAVEGITSTFREMRKTKEKLDEMLGIYSCDLIELEKTSDDFSTLVKTKGKLIYERD